MKIHFTIQDQRNGATAKVDEYFNIHSADEVLKKKILFEVDFVKTHNSYIKPLLLVFYDEIKREIPL